MELAEAGYGERIRVNMPGTGDHRRVGTIKRVKDGKVYIHLDWDERLQHLIMFFPWNLDREAVEPINVS